MPDVYDDERQKHNHDDLGVHPEHREAEINDLENRFGAPSAQERTYGNGSPSAGQLNNLEKSAGERPGNTDSRIPNEGTDLRDNEFKSIAPDLRTKAGMKGTGGRDLAEGFTGDKWYKPGAEGYFDRVKQSAKSNNMQKKMLIAGIGAGAGMGIIGFIVIIFFIISLLKIPDLGQNILEFQFARLTRQYAESDQTVTDEALADEASDEASQNAFQEAWGNAKGTVGDTWRSLDKYRPAKVIANLKAQDDGGLKLTYTEPNKLGFQQLSGVELDGVQYSIEQQGFTRFIPGLNNVIKFKNQYEFAQDFQPALDTALRDTEAGPIIRGIAENNLRKELGISLYAWVLARFNGKSGDAAEAEAGREQAEAIDDDADTVADAPVTSGLEEGTSEAETDEQNAVQSGSDAVIDNALNNGGVLSTVRTALADAMEKSGISAVGSTIASFINPIYAPAIAICTVYDGSLDSSGGEIDKSTTQEQSAFYFIESAGDQEKAGDQSPTDWGELDSAIGGTNDILGNTADSNAYLRASGQPVDTSTDPSAEASAGGQYTLLNATLGSLGIPGAGAIVTVMNAFATKVCPVATNLWAALGIGVGNLILGFLSGGTSDAAETAAGDAADQVVNYEAKNFVVNLVTKYAGKTAGRMTELVMNVGKETVKTGVKLAAITVFAKFIVAMRAGQAFSGLSTDKDLADEADAGGNINANEMERTQLFGRPLTEPEVCQSNQQDQQFILGMVSKESAYERYVDPNNADSLLSHTAIDMDGDVSSGIGNTLVSFGSTLLQPYTSLRYITDMFTGLANAAPNCNDNANDYGNVQFGWSQAEENLYDSNASYEPINNAQILDASGNADAIAQKYAVCFGYTYNANGDGSLNPLDPNGDLQLADAPGDPASMGNVLASSSPEYIVRDTNGNVLPNQGLCSPENLGYDSPDPLAADNDNTSPQKNDMIFRWRLALNYETTLTEQLNEQAVGAS